MKELFRQKLILLLLFSLASFSIKSQYVFIISGTLPATYKGVELTLSNPGFVITASPKLGKFELAGEISNEIQRVNFTIKQYGKMMSWFSFFIKEGEMKLDISVIDKITLNSNVVFHNVPFLEEQRRYDSIMKSFEDSLRSSFTLLQDVKKGYLPSLSLDSVTIEYRKQKVRKLKATIDLIKENRDNLFGLYILKEEILSDAFHELIIDTDSLISIFKTQDESLAETVMWKEVQSYLLKKKELTLNEIPPVFSFITHDGKPYNLASFRNKTNVLLLFWDSWCGPCIKSFPTLKRIEKEYADKDVQLISVSIDKSEIKWLNSLQRHDLPWLQTLDLDGYVTGPSIRSLYNIHYTPQYFLIDKDGRLIYHNVQSKDDDQYSILIKILDGLSPGTGDD